MWPEFGSLPPGIVPLILIFGGLAFSLPVTAATMLKPPAPRPIAEPRRRSVLVEARAVDAAAAHLDLDRLPPVDAALELTFRAGAGDPRIMYSDARRKLVRVTPPEGRAVDDAFRENARRVLEDAFGRVLRRSPTVTELATTEGRCDFLVTY